MVYERERERVATYPYTYLSIPSAKPGESIELGK
jgi:hypothetical protein